MFNYSANFNVSGGFSLTNNSHVATKVADWDKSGRCHPVPAENRHWMVCPDLYCETEYAVIVQL